MAVKSVADTVFMEPDAECVGGLGNCFYRTDEEHPCLRTGRIPMEIPLVFIHDDDSQVFFCEPIDPLLFVFPDEMQDFIGKSGIRLGRNYK